MSTSKHEVKQKLDDQIKELEGMLAGVMAPVAPRGEFVNQLHKRLENRFDPQPIFILPTKFINSAAFILLGVISGTLLALLGIRWIKSNRKNKWINRGLKFDQ